MKTLSIIIAITATTIVARSEALDDYALSTLHWVEVAPVPPKRRRGASRRNGIRFRVRVFREERADPADPLNYVISPSALG